MMSCGYNEVGITPNVKNTKGREGGKSLLKISNYITAMLGTIPPPSQNAYQLHGAGYSQIRTVVENGILVL